MRVVLDTNVLLSGLMTPDAPPGMLLRAWVERRFTLVTSKVQLAELQRVLSYPKLRRRIPKHVAGTLINRLRERAVFVEPTRTPVRLLDEDDLLILGTAVAGKAELLVTGDKSHLLGLKKYGKTRIVSPAQAVKELGVSRGR